jgi:hypothetical protein
MIALIKSPVIVMKRSGFSAPAQRYAMRTLQS